MALAKLLIVSVLFFKGATASKNTVSHIQTLDPIRMVIQELSGRIDLVFNFCLLVCYIPVSRHRTLMNVFDKSPLVDKDVFVAPSASVIGDVQIGKGSSIWYGCVLRGDVNNISVGSGTNIQDNSLVHVAKTNLGGKVLPTTIGDNVTVGKP